MKRFTEGRRRFLKAVAAGGGAALLGAGGTGEPAGAGATGRAAPAAAPASAPPDLAGLRERIDHIVVIFQENRSFDHYFGAYRAPGGAAVEGLLDASGQVAASFEGWQKNAAGSPYRYLPMPTRIPGFVQGPQRNRPFHLAPFVPAHDNIPYDPLHAFHRMSAQINRGRMDRFVALAAGGHHAFYDKKRPRSAVQRLLEGSSPSGAVLGFYRREDLSDYHRLADEFVLFDHFFQAMTGGSTGNALYLVAARSCRRTRPLPRRDRKAELDPPYDAAGVLINDLPPVNGPTETFLGSLDLSPPPLEQTHATIGDRLAAAGISWGWYNEGWRAVSPWALKNAFGPGDGSVVVDSTENYLPHHNPFQYFPSWFDNVRRGRIRDSDDFLADLAGAALPQVCFLKATGSHDEHPANSAPQWGERWVLSLLKALAASRYWARTLVLLTYDEGGGYWDHLAPPVRDAYGCGTRIPALLISPWARRGFIDHRAADTTSVLALIEARFALAPLQAADARAYPLLDGLDFAQAPRAAPFA